MEIEDLTMKQAEELFFSEKGQQSWAVITQIVGPALERSFVDDYITKLYVSGAFGAIMIRRNKELASEALNQIKKSCVTNYDWAVWAFSMGIYYEIFGDQRQMVSYYVQTIENYSGFYTAYLRMAKKAYAAADYCTAKKYYLGGISCFDQNELNEQDKTILAISYHELAGCLLMMHCYDEAENALRASHNVLSQLPVRSATEALLFAVKGDKKRVKMCLSELKEKVPMAYGYTKTTTEQILRKENPHFFVVETEEAAIKHFWRWFSEHQEELIVEDTDSVAAVMQRRLERLFPFVERVPELKVEAKAEECKITFSDGFTRSLSCGYEKLINACPEELRIYWKFEIDHFYQQIQDFDYTIRVASTGMEPERNTPKESQNQTVAMENIWDIKDAGDFVAALSEHIANKCQYGDNMSALNEPERIFYITQILEIELNNGGFDQFFFNSSGDFANELVHAFTEIGATKTAEICKKAVSIYSGEVPADRDEREDILADNEKLQAILNECDDAFFKYEEDLNTLNYRYIMKNKASFQ